MDKSNDDDFAGATAKDMKVIFGICAVGMLAAVVVCLLLTGCNRTARVTVQGGGSGTYLPGENFSDGGKTRCGSINHPGELRACRP